MQVVDVAIAEIVVGRRFRAEMGDIDALAKSIAEIGLLEPIGVTKDRRLVFGERRIRAYETLGRPAIAAQIINISSILLGEYAENELRKDFTTSERVAIGQAIEEELGERQGQRTDLGTNVPKLEGRTADIAAQKAGFGSGKSYERAKQVVEHGAPELIAAMDAGTASIATAAEIASAPTEQQKQIVAKGEAEILRAAKDIKRERAHARVEERRRKQEELLLTDHPLSGDSYRLLTSSVADLAAVSDASVDAIITDPPYPAEFLPAYSELSRTAARVLKPGGLCLVMVGQSHIQEILERLSEHLTYQWTIAYLTPGQSTQVFGRRIKSNWKPIIYMVNGKCEWEHVEDSLSSDRNDKRFHHWGQSVGGMAQIIERFTVRGAVVLDPFCGGGATGVAALSTGRVFIGSDIDAACIEQTAQRLAQVTVSEVA